LINSRCSSCLRRDRLTTSSRARQVARILRQEDGFLITTPNRAATFCLLVLGACSSGSKATEPQAPAPETAAAATAGCSLKAGTTVATYEFTSPQDRVRVSLLRGCLYWASTDQQGVRLDLRPRSSGMQPPYMGQVMSAGAQGGSTWEIRPAVDGDYDIRSSGQTGGRAVRLTVTVRGPVPPAK
jgi:hypothetical protein